MSRDIFIASEKCEYENLFLSSKKRSEELIFGLVIHGAVVDGGQEIHQLGVNVVPHLKKLK